MALLRESDTSELIRRWTGLTNEDIAREVGIPAGIVNRHVADVNRRLIARSQARASRPLDDPAGDESGLEAAVLQLGIRLATEVASLSGERYSVDYLRISGDTVIPLMATATPTGNPNRTFPLKEHPFVTEMVVTKQPRAGVLRTRRLGAQARTLAAQMGIVAGGGVPVKLKDSVHGIISLSTRGVQPSHELLQHLATVARIIELALVNHR